MDDLFLFSMMATVGDPGAGIDLPPTRVATAGVNSLSNNPVSPVPSCLFFRIERLNTPPEKP